MVEDMTACLPNLVHMKVDPAIGINLTRYCINPRASYLARVQDVEAIHALRQLDVAVDIAICRVAEHTPRLTDEEEDNGHRPITIPATASWGIRHQNIILVSLSRWVVCALAASLPHSSKSTSRRQEDSAKPWPVGRLWLLELAMQMKTFPKIKDVSSRPYSWPVDT
jgi:hypothetical protein